MFVQHVFKDLHISKKIDEETGFLLTNRNGGFCTLGISSRFSGVFFLLHNELFKILEDIRIPGKTLQLANHFWKAERRKNDVLESFFMPYSTNSIVYELSQTKSIELLFDLRKGYDNRIWGNNYSITKEDNMIVITFTKTTHEKEDNTDGHKEFSCFIAIHCDSLTDIELLDTWEKKSYSYDQKRNSPPFERYVYNGIRLKSKKLIISCAKEKKKALQECKQISSHLDKYKKLQKKYSQVSSTTSHTDSTLALAYKSALTSLDNLVVHKRSNFNVYAGLPWFFQYWGRDTLISLKALMLDKEYKIVKSILISYLDLITREGLLPNRIPHSNISSADAIGWYFKRFDEFLDILSKEKKLYHYFTKTELAHVKEKLSQTVNNVFKKFTRDSFATNNPQETWMDTSYTKRSGIRLEIQALRLCMYSFMSKISHDKFYKNLEEKLLKKTKKTFWNGTYLKDGLDDETIRCNIFVAAYLYPSLLTQQEWEKCFDSILPKLWLSWGGISTLDKNNPSFQPDNTGEDSKSYHQGDSWYWINNLTALVLSRTNYSKYTYYINALISASCEDILFKGYSGSHSEISSASMQEALGCLNQAWSNALFVELINELQKKR